MLLAAIRETELELRTVGWIPGRDGLLALHEVDAAFSL